MRELQPQLDSIFRPEPHFCQRGFGVFQQADDQNPMFSLLGPDGEARLRLTKSGEMGVLPEIAFASW
jgi:hypothetical protein